MEHRLDRAAVWLGVTLTGNGAVEPRRDTSAAKFTPACLRFSLPPGKSATCCCRSATAHPGGEEPPFLLTVSLSFQATQPVLLGLVAAWLPMAAGPTWSYLYLVLHK
jgi:hypothetical protein